MASERLIESGVPTRQLKSFRVLPFNLVPGVVRTGNSYYSDEAIAAMIMADARDEITMLL